MREIKFRGKSIDNGEWVYGDLVYGCTANPYIIDERGVELFVIPETVGQYIGLKDREGVEIYEGDIIKGEIEGNLPIMGYIKFNKETMQYVLVNEVETPLYRVCIKKVIGNEYENPELLEGELNENN